jgi:hypothetical protein
MKLRIFPNMRRRKEAGDVEITLSVVDGRIGTHLLKEEMQVELCKWEGCAPPWLAQRASGIHPR